MNDREKAKQKDEFHSRKIRELSLMGLTDQEIEDHKDVPLGKTKISQIRKRFKIPSGDKIKKAKFEQRTIVAWNNKNNVVFVSKTLGMTHTGCKQKLVKLFENGKIEDKDGVLNFDPEIKSENERKKKLAIKVWEKSLSFERVSKECEITLRAAKAKIRAYIKSGECKGEAEGISGVRSEPMTIRKLEQERLNKMPPWIADTIKERRKSNGVEL